MSKESGVRFAVLDPALYGAARVFDYLGVHGQDMLDKIGEGIIEYGLAEGYFEQSNNPHEFVGNIVTFFIQNGYLSNIKVDQTGETMQISMRNWRFLPLMKKLRNRNSYLLTCPVCMANDAVRKSGGLMGERISEDVTADGTYTMTIKMVPGIRNTKRTVIPLKPADLSNITLASQTNEIIGLPAFEAVAYGLARAFDYLGAQAQLLLDNVGAGEIEFLQEELQISLPDEPSKAVEDLALFFTRNRLADEIRPQISPSEAKISFTNYRYARVLKRLLNGGISLTSCPFTIAVRTLLRQRNLAVGDVKWKFVSERDVTLTMPLARIAERQFDEEKVASLM
jgi:hypothetical protein